MKYLFSIVFAVLLLSCGEEAANTNKELEKDSLSKVNSKQTLPVFEKIPASASGLYFSNDLKENVGTLENLFDFDYFYNGAGVGVADINNDGLQDIFFAGNQVENKLYLNKGDLQFEDVSASAGINIGKQWSNGVTFADVNGDGWLDIYVSQGGPKQQKDRKNLLFINKKDGSFTESAQQFNVADEGISTQSIFFDYDNDGDLDLLVSNENEFYGLDPKRFMAQMSIEKNLEKSSVNLYENKGNTFEKITKKAGLLTPAFGLGPIVSDINNDGWLDVYVANDYYIPDAMYINNQDGTFTDRVKEYTSQVSFYGMGVDIADVNNDHLQDIFVLDMAASDHIRSKTLMASMNLDRFNMLVNELGFAYQYMFNSLQLNKGNNRFHNVVQQAKMAKTDWSWAGLIADLDNNATRDVYVTNGYRRYALDNDLQNQVREVRKAFRGNVPLEAKQKLYDAMPTEKLSNIMFKNEGDLSFKNVAYQWGLAVPSYSNGGAYADLDNDGDLELIVSNIDEEAFLFKNTSVDQNLGNYLRVNLIGQTSEPFAKVTIEYDGESQIYETKRAKGYLSATENVAHFGLGNAQKVDKVIVQWMSGKREERLDVPVNSIVGFVENKATLTGAPVFENDEVGGYAFAKADIPQLKFTHKENAYNDFEKEILLPYKQSTLGPFMSKGDVNGDGLDDFYIGGASGQEGELFIQTASGFVSRKVSKPSIVTEDMGSLFVDIDGDNDEDLIVLSGGSEFDKGSKLHQNRLYLNDGTGNLTYTALDNGLMNSKSITAIDFDNDGDQDLVIGNRIQPQHYPVPVSSQLLENKNGKFIDVTREKASGLMDFGIVNDVIATDFNSDGKTDFIVVGEWAYIGMFQNDGNTFTNISASLGLENEKGWWFTVKEIDLNKDGLPDYIVGNIGSNVKYKASQKEPFKVFANDFDDNGSFDLVLSNAYNGVYVPARGKECSTQQMPFISEKFTTYNDFANATLEDIYGEKLTTGYSAEVTTFKSVMLLNTGNGKFEVQALPALAQTAPILDVIVMDVNQDGFEDAVVTGNIYEAEVETPRYDTGSGIVLLSNGSNGFEAINPATRGLYFENNAKSLLKLNHKGLNKQLVLAGINDGELEIYQFNQ